MEVGVEALGRHCSLLMGVLLLFRPASSCRIHRESGASPHRGSGWHSDAVGVTSGEFAPCSLQFRAFVPQRRSAPCRPLPGREGVTTIAESCVEFIFPLLATGRTPARRTVLHRVTHA